MEVGGEAVSDVGEADGSALGGPALWGVGGVGGRRGGVGLKKLPQVLSAVGSPWRPSTANGVERFFGSFDRFYRVKGPFCALASAQKHLQLFVLWYLLRGGTQGQACPLERAGGKASPLRAQARRVEALPLYHLLNRPKVRMLRERMAQESRQTA